MKGLTVSVYRDDMGGDYSNDGLSAGHPRLTLIGPGISGPFEPTQEMPAVCLVRRAGIRRDGGEYVHAVPADADGKPLPGGWMFGGTYIKTPDSRFPHDYPIPLHDRQEGEYRTSEHLFNPPASDLEGLINQVTIIRATADTGDMTEVKLLLEALIDDLHMSDVKFSWR